MRPILILNLVTIARTLSEQQFCFEIQDGGVRHVGFHENSGFQTAIW